MSRPRYVYDYTLGDMELELRQDLGLTNDLKKIFKREFTVLTESLGDLSIDEYVKFVYTSIYEPSMKFDEFKEEIYSGGVGVLDLIDCITTINWNLQMPGKTKEEQKQIMANKYKERRELQDMSQA